VCINVSNVECDWAGRGALGLARGPVARRDSRGTGVSVDDPALGRARGKISDI
jgi:hypothetical protein